VTKNIQNASSLRLFFALPLSSLPLCNSPSGALLCLLRQDACQANKKRMSRKHLSGQPKKLKLIEFFINGPTAELHWPKGAAAGHLCVGALQMANLFPALPLGSLTQWSGKTEEQPGRTDAQNLWRKVLRCEILMRVGLLLMRSTWSRMRTTEAGLPTPPADFECGMRRNFKRGRASSRFVCNAV